MLNLNINPSTLFQYLAVCHHKISNSHRSVLHCCLSPICIHDYSAMSKIIYSTNLVYEQFLIPITLIIFAVVSGLAFSIWLNVVQTTSDWWIPCLTAFFFNGYSSSRTIVIAILFLVTQLLSLLLPSVTFSELFYSSMIYGLLVYVLIVNQYVHQMSFLSISSLYNHVIDLNKSFLSSLFSVSCLWPFWEFCRGSMFSRKDATNCISNQLLFLFF